MQSVTVVVTHILGSTTLSTRVSPATHCIQGPNVVPAIEAYKAHLLINPN